MTRHLLTHPLLLASLLAVGACVAEDEDDTSYLTEVLPDERVLVSLPTSDAAAARTVGDWSEFYLATADATDDVNGLIAGVLSLLDQVVQTRPSDFDRAAHRAVWGPYGDTLDPVQTWVIVEYDPTTDVHTWAFAQRPKGDEEAEGVVVIAGEVDAGATREDHTGRFVMDFTMLHELDPNVDHTGIFYSEYDVDPTGVSAEAAVEGWQDVRLDEGPYNAVYLYAQTPDGAGEMDLAWQGDYLDDGELDVYALRSRWDATGAGRGDAFLVDSGETLLGAASECWDDSFRLVYRVDTWEGEVGEVDACVYPTASYVGE